MAEDIVRTTGEPAGLITTANRDHIGVDGDDLSFITVKVVDDEGLTLPTASNTISFTIDGPAEIVATDNGDPTNFTPFFSHIREAFNGFALAIAKGSEGENRVQSLFEQKQIVLKVQPFNWKRRIDSSFAG